MPHVVVPRWALASAVGAPVVLIAGWVLAAQVQPHGYNPVRQTISVLAAHGAVDRWLMTGAIAATGLCHVFTAFGLAAAARVGRILLACGGVATILVAAFPEPHVGTTVQHTAATTAALVAFAVWPGFAAVWRRTGGAVRHHVPWPLRRWPSVAVTAALALLGVWFLVVLRHHEAVGFWERVLTTVQSVWPVVVVAACVRHYRRPAGPLPAEAVAAEDLGRTE